MVFVPLIQWSYPRGRLHRGAANLRLSLQKLQRMSSSCCDSRNRDVWEMWHRWKCVGILKMIRISDFIGGELKHVHFLNLAEYVSGRLFSVWIASKVDVFSPFLSLLLWMKYMCFLTWLQVDRVLGLQPFTRELVGATLQLCLCAAEMMRVYMACVLPLMDASRVVIWRRMIHPLQLKQLFWPLKPIETSGFNL